MLTRSLEEACESDETFTFERTVDPHAPNARLLLVGALGRTGTYSGASPAETGEGRKLLPAPLLLPDPRWEGPPESPEEEESDEEGWPKRGNSAPPPCGDLVSLDSTKKFDIGWAEDRNMYRRFGYLHTMSHFSEFRYPVIIESADNLVSLNFHLEIVSASSMPDINFDLSYDVSL